MIWFEKLFKRKPSASIAKERLSIVLSHTRGKRGKDFIGPLKEELIAVICKYTSVNKDALSVTLERRDSIDVLKVDVALPEGGARRA